MAPSQYEALPHQDSDQSEFLPRIRPAESYDDLNPEHHADHLTEQHIALTPDSEVSRSPVSTPTRPDSRSRPSISLTRPDSTTLPFEEKDGEAAGTAFLLDEDRSYRIRYSIAPETHHAVNFPKKPSPRTSPAPSLTSTETPRAYNYWIQTKRLWRLAAAEWLMTAVICGLYGGLLAYFSTQLLMTRQVLLFNSMATILTFLLGVNLAASMRSYAKLLRWLLLSLCWQPLETFDIILRCDSLLNVVKLFWKIRKQGNKRLRWITQGLALSWLVSNMALTLLVGMLGLVSNIGYSSDYIGTSLGTTQVTDFAALDTGDSRADLARIQEWGEAGYYVSMSPEFGYDWTSYSSMQTLQNGSTYDFINAWNPDDLSIEMVSWAYIESKAMCTSYDVVRGGNGNSYSVSIPYGGYPLYNITVAYNKQNLPGLGGTVALAALCEECKSRTTPVHLFVAASEVNGTSKYFVCNNTVSDIWWYNPKHSLDRPAERAPAEYQFPNSTARMLAGAIGWNGDYSYYTTTDLMWQGVAYPNISMIGASLREMYGDMPTEENVADFISSYTMKSLYMIDGNYDGLQVSKFVFGQIPLRAQVLSVTKQYAIALLCFIPVLQLMACVMVFVFANKAIIKDDSPLSMAKLYFSILQKYGLGDKGCLLTGDEIVKYIEKETKDPNGVIVTYGWKDSGHDDHRGRPIGHIDVFEQVDEEKEVELGMGRPGAYTPVMSIMQDRGRVKKVFKDDIMYDGMQTGVDSGTDAVLRRRKGRSASF